MIYTSHVFYNHYLIYLSIKITNKCSFAYTHAPAPALLFFVQILIKRNISFFGFPAFPSLIAKALKDRRIVYFCQLNFANNSPFLKGLYLQNIPFTNLDSQTYSDVSVPLVIFQNCKRNKFKKTNNLEETNLK